MVCQVGSQLLHQLLTSAKAYFFTSTATGQVTQPTPLSRVIAQPTTNWPLLHEFQTLKIIPKSEVKGGKGGRYI